MNIDSISIFAVDVGSQKNFAWVSCVGIQGEDGDSLVDAITIQFAAGRRVALGFECPLFIPVPHRWSDIGKRRVGEGNRSWSAGGGATVTTYGLHEVAWILARLREVGNTDTPIFFSPENWLSSAEPCLLLWEAFVTGKDKGQNHADDAKLACEAFQRLMNRNDWDEARQVKTGNEAQSMNLAAFAAKWAGWSISASELKTELLVVKPTIP
jgi:hypothetical protein